MEDFMTKVVSMPGRCIDSVASHQCSCCKGKSEASNSETKAKPSQRGIKREKSPPPPRRSSMRLKKLEPSGTPLPVEPEPVELKDEHARPPAGPLGMSDRLYGNTDIGHCNRLREKIEHFSDTKAKVIRGQQAKSTLDSYIKSMAKTKLTSDRVAKVVPDRVFSVAIHPTRDKVLVAGGGKWGAVGLWDVDDIEDDQQGVVTLVPHSRPVNHLIFPTWHQDRLYSCSYDGSLRCAHFDRGVFEEVYSAPVDEYLLLRNFECLNVDSLLVGQSDGSVAMVDRRTPGTEAESLYSLHRKPLRTVSVHPVQKDYFITSCADGNVSLWDIRNLKSGMKKNNSSIVDLHHGKGVNSAYFSPITGNFILTTSMDDKLSVFDSSSLTTKIPLKKAIRHNNYTGRWLTVFRAVWHPAREDIFVVGSMERPRRIEVIDLTGNLVHTFDDEEYLGSVCSQNAFHPTRPVVVGGNSSGRLHVFM
ncbi:WD repeat-containing protein 76-like [Liolophura sinensis]|uniref:WD repeat-containing protein 76-like n=1 Tax=Liolophura sinensis TaxID=3198878 RepID=UPI0031584FD4